MGSSNERMMEYKCIRCCRSLLAVLVLAAVMVVEPAAGEAAVYICRDGSGGEQYTNVPTGSGCSLFRKKSSFGSRRMFVSKRRVSRDSFAEFRGNSYKPYDALIRSSGRRYNVDPHLIKAVIKTESDFNSRAVSHRGAKGLMQLMPATARGLKVRNPFDPRQNIDGGTRYLRKMLNLFHGDVALSLAAYNAGPTIVRKVQRVPRIPETMRYVRKVLAYYEGYKGAGRINSSARIRVNKGVVLN